MKMLAKTSIFILPLAFLAGCLPDLTITRLDVSAWRTSRIAVADIRNRGWKNAGPFRVYFDAEEGTILHSQVIKDMSGLNKRISIRLTANFASEGSPPNANLDSVRRIIVCVDAKNMVKESNERNNSMAKPVP
jgi:hypothetical protein